MYWLICLSISIILFSISLVFVLTNYIKKKFDTVIFVRSLVAVIFLGIFPLMIPVCIEHFMPLASGDRLKGAIISIQNTLQVFSLDGDYYDFYDNINSGIEFIDSFYKTYSVILFILAPLSTLTFILTFLSNIAQIFRLIFDCSKSIYVFSELNEKSIHLATSIYNKENHKAKIVFCDVFEENEEESYELKKEVKKIKSICFRSDITNIRFLTGIFTRKAKITYYIISDDENESLNQAMHIIRNNKYNDKVAVYLFTRKTTTDVILSSALTNPNTFNDDKEKQRYPLIDFRQVNEYQQIAYRYLEENQIYDQTIIENGKKKLKIAIVGAGTYGSSLFKALYWYARVPRIEVDLHIIDKKEQIESSLLYECPALNLELPDIENYLKITYHSGIDALSLSLDECLNKLGLLSHVFVLLGEDQLNTEVAIHIKRNLLAQSVINHYLQEDGKPADTNIITLIQDSSRIDSLNDALLYAEKGGEYKINYLSNLDMIYTIDKLGNTDTEKKAYDLHVSWSKDNDSELEAHKAQQFYYDTYKFRSSIARAMRHNVRVKQNVMGAADENAILTQEQKIERRCLEHACWMAFMISEGYRKGDIRNDIAKTTPQFVSYHELDEKDKNKDDF